MVEECKRREREAQGWLIKLKEKDEKIRELTKKLHQNTNSEEIDVLKGKYREIEEKMKLLEA
jgi:chromosome segregation ATPase